MQTKSPLAEDFARLMQGAAGVAQAANEELRALYRSMVERAVADADLAKREEVEALKALARRALEQVEALEKRVADLETKSGDR